MNSVSSSQNITSDTTAETTSSTPLLNLKKQKRTLKICKESFEALPEKVMVVERLQLASGSLNILCAAGNSGKSMFLQYLATCVSSGTPLFNTFEVSQGDVYHFDQEQSEAQTLTRYLRIAGGIGLESLDVYLEKLYNRFPAKLSNSQLLELERELTDTFKGVKLVVIDSLRAITLADENNGDMEPLLKLLKSVAEKTNTCIVLIHHKGKYSSGAVQTGRGSSSIYDSLDVQIDIDRIDRGLCSIKCTKIRDGIEFEHLEFKFEDAGDYIRRRKCSSQLKFEMVAEGIESKDVKIARDCFRLIHNNPGTNISKLTDELKIAKKTVMAAVDKLASDGFISKKQGAKNAWLLVPTFEGIQHFDTKKEDE